MDKLTLAESLYRVHTQTEMSQVIQIMVRTRGCTGFSVNSLRKGYEIRIQTTGNTFNRSVQILARVDDKDDIARTRENLIQAFISLKQQLKRCA
jgi:NAD(P)H-nitrite reductase large subunit